VFSGEVYDFYSVSPEYFGYALVIIIIIIIIIISAMEKLG
jgi:hypothetical protein